MGHGGCSHHRQKKHISHNTVICLRLRPPKSDNFWGHSQVENQKSELEATTNHQLDGTNHFQPPTTNHFQPIILKLKKNQPLPPLPSQTCSKLLPWLHLDPAGNQPGPTGWPNQPTSPPRKMGMISSWIEEPKSPKSQGFGSQAKACTVHRTCAFVIYTCGVIFQLPGQFTTMWILVQIISTFECGKFKISSQIQAVTSLVQC